jgi:hypothetical protein
MWLAIRFYSVLLKMSPDSYGQMAVTGNYASAGSEISTYISILQSVYIQ